jgi:hypothetical protein
MEFLPPEGTAKGKGKGKETYTRVRLAWYYRPSDVSDRPVADSRLLLAAIYSEVCDINQLRSKCFVIHRDKISDLAGWKKRPDRFYFNRLFDPYIKKEFEVIQAADVRNRTYHKSHVFSTQLHPSAQYPITYDRSCSPDMNMWSRRKMSFQTSRTPFVYAPHAASGAQSKLRSWYFHARILLTPSIN